jgi:GNAT superfamily N-acetyltransferase
MMEDHERGAGDFGPAAAYLVSAVSASLRPQLQDMRTAMRACFDRDRRSNDYSGLAPSQLPVRGPFNRFCVEPNGYKDDLLVWASFLALAKTSQRGRPVGFATFGIECLIGPKPHEVNVEVSVHSAWLAPRHRGRGNGKNLAECLAHALVAFLERLQQIGAAGATSQRPLGVRVTVQGDVHSNSGERFVYAAKDAVTAWFQDLGVDGVELRGLAGHANW